MRAHNAGISVLLALALAGCGSDDVDPPDATLETPGAIVAQEEAPGQIRLVRTIGAFGWHQGETALFLTYYEPRVATFEEARELGKRTDLEVEQQLSMYLLSAFTQHPYEVVWFRTLEEWEYDLLH